ncbi:MAG TPA: dienelactone hydrolase family protein [Spirochaetia bacterium]|nr:dienelactone hydrolase family protein [Spirochaetia bacterium]
MRVRRLPAVLFFLGSVAVFGQSAGLPPAEADAKARLENSPRHGEWVTIDAGAGDKVDAWVVYPERSDRAPVVLVVHEIFGLSDWVRAVTDQLAAEGFIAIAPDLISGKAPGGKGSRAVGPDDARTLIAGLDPSEIVRRLNATAKYATSLPAARPRFAVVGFCWGGGVSFSYATEQPGLSAAVVFYGVAPSAQALSRIKAPVLGLYGGNDERVDATVGPAAEEMKKLGESFQYQMFAGAGHAFMRAQAGQSGANRRAAEQAWPRAIGFLKQNLSSGTSSVSPRDVEIGLLQTTRCGHIL